MSMKSIQPINTFLAILFATQAYATNHWLDNLNNGQRIVQLGAFSAKQGKAQHINIDSLIGDNFSVDDDSDQNLMLGFGYYLPSTDYQNFSLSYGLNGFYLAQTEVRGKITQENLFTNLAYKYKISNLPIYAVAKALIKSNDTRYNITFDAGIGPNFIQTNRYTEKPLDTVTLPSYRFPQNTKIALSAMAGIGLRMNHLLPDAPVECGYRLLYLGQGELHSPNSQVLDNLKTGHSYAHAVTCGIIF